MKEERQRTATFAKDRAYEQAVELANAMLAEADVEHAPPAKTVLFVAGLPRSGTTLLYQLLAAAGCFGYCSNLMARFHRRPALGALVQRLSSHWLIPSEPTFSSRAGATPGWSEPHEFGYFWESHFPFAENHQPESEVLAGLDLSRLASLIGELEETLRRSLVFKNVILSFVLGRLTRDLPTMRVVRIRRPRLDVALSLTAVRRAYFGDPEAWFSVRPAGAEAMLQRPAAQQIAFQMARVEAALEDARAQLGPERWLEVDYAALCGDPRATLTEVTAFAGVDPATADFDLIPERFAAKEHETSPETRDLADALGDAGLAAQEVG